MGTDNAAHSDLDADIRKEIIRSLGVPKERVLAAASIVDDLGADSLLHVTLVMDLERRFGISIPDAEAARLVTVGDVIAAVRARITE